MALTVEYCYSQNLDRNVSYSYDEVYSHSDGLAPVRKGNLWGFIDHNLELVISYQYDDTGSFEHGVCSVEKNGKWFFINSTGEKISGDYDKINYMSNRVAYVKKDGKWGALDFEMNQLFACTYDQIPYAKSKQSVIYDTQTGKKGINDFDGNEIVPAIYDNIDYLGGYYFCATYVGGGAYFDMTGNQLTPFEYNPILSWEFENGYSVSTKSDGTSAVINDDLKTVHSGYESYIPFRGNLFIVDQRMDTSGIFDVIAKEWVYILPEEYGSPFPVSKEFIEVYSADGKVLIDSKGDLIISPIKSGSYLDLGVILFEDYNNMGFYVPATGFTSTMDYDAVRFIEEHNLVLASSNGVGTLFHAEGHIIAEQLKLGEWIIEGDNYIAVRNDAGKWGFIKISN